MTFICWERGISFHVALNTLPKNTSARLSFHAARKKRKHFDLCQFCIAAASICVQCFVLISLLTPHNVAAIMHALIKSARQGAITGGNP
jgi:hypothetical protein